MSRFMAAIFQPLQLLQRSLHAVAQNAPTNSLVKPDNCLFTSIRTKVRCYFPRPNEVRRVRRHGWNYRMSTSHGRRVIMRRLLKGRYVLTH